MKDLLKNLKIIVDSLDFATEYNAALIANPKKYERASIISTNLKKCIKNIKEVYMK